MARVEEWGRGVGMRQRVTLCDTGRQCGGGSCAVGMTYVAVWVCDGADM